MYLGALTAAALFIPPAPPPPPTATTPRVLASIDAARTCFEQRWEVARERRFAAERLVKPLTAPVGSSEWIAARTSVLALVAARRELRDCADQVVRTTGSETDADRAPRGYWAGHMFFNIDGQASYEQALLVGLIDRSFGNPILGPVPEPR
jgi:hypothetical protein